jgi:hypothetical protein
LHHGARLPAASTSTTPLKRLGTPACAAYWLDIRAFGPMTRLSTVELKLIVVKREPE